MGEPERAGHVEAILAAHPEVDRVRVLEVTGGGGEHQLVAFVAAVGSVRGPALDVAEWAEIFDAVYEMSPVGGDPTLNSAGWTNSHTGESYRMDEVRDSVAATAARIRTLPHERVLEVGCGTGMILSRVAPHSRRYLGVDPAETGLAHIRDHVLAANPTFAERVELRTLLAHELGALADQEFDLVVLNSVIQYFPSGDYLADVLAQAVALLAPGGSVFVGDVRNLVLHAQLQTSIQLRQAPAGLDLTSLRGRVLEHVWHEPELLVHPMLFDHLRTSLPGVNSVRVLLKHGTEHNELNGFRYDVVLSTSAAGTPSTRSVQWGGEGVEELTRLLDTTDSDVLEVLGVPNGQVWSACAGWSALTSSQVRDVDDLRTWLAGLDQGMNAGIVPAMAALRPGWRIEARWPRSGVPDTFDIVACRAGAPEYVPEPGTADAQRSIGMTNRPAAGGRPRQLAALLREHLAERCPALSVAVVVVDDLPIPPDGVVDDMELADLPYLRVLVDRVPHGGSG